MKNNQGRNLLFISCFIFLLMSCESPVPPEYQGFENVQISKMSIEESQISADLKFYNSNHFSLQLKHAEMDVFVNDNLADHYVLDSTIHIPKEDSFYIPVTIKIDLRHLLSNAVAILMNKEVKISLKGSAKLKGAGIPFSIPLLYEGTQKLDF